MRTNRKEEIISAAISLVAKTGVASATIRSIARLAGVTEAAIYRHFTSKEELIHSIYQRIVQEMVQAKEMIATSPKSFYDKISDWVLVSYKYYDEHPDAFIFLYLTPHTFDEVNVDTIDRQGDLFLELISQAQAKGEVRSIKPELALSHFTGIELNIPKLIHAGRIEGPACQYASETVEAIFRVLSPDAATP